jgi:hypothetical protein
MSKIKEFLAFVPRDPKLLAYKRNLYVGLFVCLGLMVFYFIYVLSTVGTIFLLLLDFKRYSFGLSWEVWHNIGTAWLILCLIAGALVGYGLGKYWWRYIYVDKKLKFKC